MQIAAPVSWLGLRIKADDAVLHAPNDQVNYNDAKIVLDTAFHYCCW